jgi:RNA polymerase sigma-70 factor (ECF subfamily)
MDPQGLPDRLSRISTMWTMVLRAHETEADQRAQARLLQHYGGAVYRYLLGAVHDADVAEELAQEFALRVVRGDFRRADPTKGRFRDYLKTALSRLVTDHYRARQAWPQRLSPDAAAPAASEGADTEARFLEHWRQGLLDRTWVALAEQNLTYQAVLRHRVENPDMPSARMAEELTAKLGKPLTADSIRKTLQRAHEKFADLLIEEVARSLENPTPDELRAELQELDLLKYCRSALERRTSG